MSHNLKVVPDWTDFFFLLNLHVEILLPSVVALEGSSGRQSGHTGQGPNGWD